ncbi:VOC family protein [Dermatobacter hominis]|uniref:VOC family protein n=1 Tax=Dermatobacter hominis TaxID=2884263 RepID=UPI001D0F8979|nr:VOC family protein [Dermatobacter hominis]UDY36950.1 VOC family protein [Dermatobacter hominis]
MTDVDPLDALRGGDDPVVPGAEFSRRLRRRVADALGLPAEVPLTDIPTIDLPERDDPTDRSTAMSTTTSPTTAVPASAAVAEQTLVPYLAVHDGPAALEFYETAFGAEVTLRFDGDDGRIGHADLMIGPARFFLSDEYPEIGVRSPRTLGGTSVTLHLEVPDVDTAFARAVEAGSTAQMDPEDQPYGHRQGTLVDPFGHRWMLSQRLESVGTDELADRMSDQGFSIAGSWVDDPATSAASGRPATVARNGRIWPAIQSTDALGLIRLAVDVLGFTEQIVVPGERPDVVAHSQLAWPEGGVVQISSAARDGNPFSEQPPGSGSIYVVTDDPMAVYERCVAAGLEIIREPESPDYDPGGSGFGLRDPEGNLWSFGTYAGE